MKNYCYRITCVAAAMGLYTCAAMGAEQTGEEWEYQGSMEMSGMKMPVPAARVCQLASEDMTPPMEGNCTVTQSSTEGNTTSFSLQCGAPNPMTGSGTSTRTGDTIESRFTMTSPEGEFVIAMTGRKTGDCAPAGN